MQMSGIKAMVFWLGADWRLRPLTRSHGSGFGEDALFLTCFQGLDGSGVFEVGVGAGEPVEFGIVGYG